MARSGTWVVLPCGLTGSLYRAGHTPTRDFPGRCGTRPVQLPGKGESEWLLLGLEGCEPPAGGSPIASATTCGARHAHGRREGTWPTGRSGRRRLWLAGRARPLGGHRGWVNRGAVTVNVLPARSVVALPLNPTPTSESVS